MNKKQISFIIIFVILVFSFCTQAFAEEPKKIYHWPQLSLKPYTSLQYNHYPKGDIDNKRAFYWGRALRTDGLCFGIRNLLPHIIEGNWQEKVYNNDKEKKFIFDLAKDFQDTYAAYGCDDSFMQFHTHPPLYGESVEKWRADVITGMTQKAELMAYAGVKRILIDLEFASQSRVSTDPQFWYDLGGDIITAMRTKNTTFKFGFYPGIFSYYAFSLNNEQRKNPRSIGKYPDETSIPESKRNVRHALLEGIYNNLNGTTMWHFPGWTYSPTHMCAGTPQKPPYIFNLESMIKEIIDYHTRLLGPGIEYMPAKWDLGRTQTAPIGALWKQPNISLEMQKRNYDIVYKYTDHAATWDHRGTWDEDGIAYLTYKTMEDFEKDIADIKIVDKELPPGVFAFTSFYRYDSITGKQHHISVKADAAMDEKLKYFTWYKGPDGYHITGKQADDFPEYVNNMIVAAGKDKIAIPLRNKEEYGWAKEYQAKGFFKNYKITQKPQNSKIFAELVPEK